MKAARPGTAPEPGLEAGGGGGLCCCGFLEPPGDDKDGRNFPLPVNETLPVIFSKASGEKGGNNRRKFMGHSLDSHQNFFKGGREQYYY